VRTPQLCRVRCRIAKSLLWRFFSVWYFSSDRDCPKARSLIGEGPPSVFFTSTVSPARTPEPSRDFVSGYGDRRRGFCVRWAREFSFPLAVFPVIITWAPSKILQLPNSFPSLDFRWPPPDTLDQIQQFLDFFPSPRFRISQLTRTRFTRTPIRFPPKQSWGNSI